MDNATARAVATVCGAWPFILSNQTYLHSHEYDAESLNRLIDSTEHVLQAVREAQRPLRRVPTLNPTCLGNIFMFAAHTDRPRDERRPRIRYRGWTVVLSVNRTWRQVALSNERLMAYAHTQHPFLFTLSRDLAGNTPLNYDLAGICAKRYIHSVRRLLSETDFHLVRRISVGAQMDAHAHIEELSRQSNLGPLTHLHELNIDCTRVGPPLHRTDNSMRHCQEDPLAAPVLKIARFRHWWMPIVSSDLDYLRVEFFDRTIKRPTARQVLSNIKMGGYDQTLYQLELLAALAEDNDLEQGDLHIDLASLNVLRIEDNIKNATTILSVIERPESTIISAKVVFTKNAANESDVRLLARAIEDCPVHSVHAKYHKRTRGGFRLTLSGWTTWLRDPSFSESREEEPPGIRLDLHFPSSATLSWLDVVTIIAERWNVVEIILDVPSEAYAPLTCTSWVNFVHQLPGLEALDPRDECVDALLACRCTDAEAGHAVYLEMVQNMEEVENFPGYKWIYKD